MLKNKKTAILLIGMIAIICIAFSVYLLINRDKDSDSINSSLTLDDVIELSKKGDELSWNDFEGFPYRDIGSGLFIRVYEINPWFSLWIGGGNLNTKPMYIQLRIKTDPEDSIDIRTEDVVAFIDKYKDYLPEASIMHVYRFSDSQDITKTAQVVLYEDNTFLFTFSPISSYVGIGTYEINGSKLTLKTNDGKYIYVFDMIDDTLSFDAKASSQQVWFSGITDGSVFK